MRLSQITIGNVRNIVNAVVYPGPNLNILTGDNGSGKSSFLESIYLLGRASSFRTNHTTEIINTEARQLFVSGIVQQPTGQVQRIGISLRNKQKTIRIDGKDVNSRIELLDCLPLQFISPLSYLLIEGPPTTRRQFMDWGVFHHDIHYPEEWKRFKRCLIQRNTILKDGRNFTNAVWDVEFAKYGTIVARRREDYLDQLLPYIENIGEQMLPSKTIGFEYFPGWDLNQGLEQALRDDYKRDTKFGFTHRGPQKSELVLKVNSRNCKAFLSRGQIKLLVLVMKLAQIQLMIEKRNKFCSLLIDDFCSELDRGNAKKLKQFLSDMDLQCFITGMDRNSVGSLCGIHSTMFHVEQGNIQAT